MIRTSRLDLVPATPSILAAALEDSPSLGRSLEAEVPASWPPEFLDAPALHYVQARLGEDADAAPWWLYFVLLHAEAPRVLIGTAGYKGRPAEDGTVEIGYGIVSDRRRRGYASEAASALIGRAFDFPGVHRVVAETYPELVGSIGVLERCGFVPAGGGSEPGVIRFELPRASWERNQR